MAFSTSQYDILERAVARGSRIAVTRRGVQWIVVAQSIDTRSGREQLLARHPSTGDAMIFLLDDITHIEVVR